MADNKEQVATGGISFSGLLTILFIGLKLTHYIDWSWLWVLSPLWIPIGFILGLVMLLLVVVLIASLLIAVYEALTGK